MTELTIINAACSKATNNTNSGFTYNLLFILLCIILIFKNKIH